MYGERRAKTWWLVPTLWSSNYGCLLYLFLILSSPVISLSSAKACNVSNSSGFP
jgi:hypothetical protein